MPFTSKLALLLIAPMLSIGGCPTPPAPGTGGASVSTGGGAAPVGGANPGGSTSTKPDADRILELVNVERTTRGLVPLTRNTQLDAAALAHARDMRDNAFFDHTGSDGSTVGVRATAAGYPWTLVGENIGLASVTPQRMMQLWMDSTGHRANILNSDFRELGVAVETNGDVLWVQVFGRQ